jgi:lipopolysaccharide biosynthesis protein
MNLIRIFLGGVRYLAYLLLVVVPSIFAQKAAPANPPTLKQSDSNLWVIIHLYHVDQSEVVVREIKKFMSAVTSQVKVIATTTLERESQIKHTLDTFLPDAELFVFENRGRDVLPFLKALKSIEVKDYDIVLKIHTKADRSLVYGDNLNESSVGRFLDIASSRRVLDLTKRESFVATYKNLIFGPLALGKNLLTIKKILKTMKVKKHHLYPEFAAGSMFWMTGDIAKRFANLDLVQFDFESEPLDDDGTTAHAFERVFGYITADYDTKIVALEDL